jgi:hypothetical protein
MQAKRVVQLAHDRGREPAKDRSEPLRRDRPDLLALRLRVDHAAA